MKNEGKPYCEFLKLGGFIGMAFASSVTAQDAFKGNRDVNRPNLVLLLVDDLRWNSLGCAGNPVVQTPNVDQLAREGVRFTHACVTSSISMVSRASILTGQYMSRHGIDRFLMPLSEAAIEKTYPAILHNNGYYTGYVGKYGVGNIRESQFDYATEYEGKHWYPEGEGDSIHVTRKNLRDALIFLQQRPSDKPFCLTVGFFATHAEDGHPDQYRVQPQSEPLFRNLVIPVPETATPEYLKLLPPFISSEENEGRRRWHWRFDTPEKYQRYMKAYYRLLTEVDQAVGAIIAELKKQDAYDHTMIIFMGDNGYFHGEHQLADKWYPYEESIRIPLVVKDARIPEKMKGSVIDELVLNIDVAPALLGAGGIPIPAGMQGQDFSDLFGEGQHDWRREFYYEHPVVIDVKRIPASQAIITKEAKYIWWPDFQFEEYFDLKKDPCEVYNCISDVKYRQEITILKERFSPLKTSVK
jgi:arylsulfatase A-like enzyme